MVNILGISLSAFICSMSMGFKPQVVMLATPSQMSLLRL